MSAAAEKKTYRDTIQTGKYQHISVPLLILNISLFENHQCIARAVSITFIPTTQENRSNQSAALEILQRFPCLAP
jgi:hypothetical protein